MNTPRIRTTEEFDSGEMVVDGDHFERHVVRMSPGFKQEFAWVDKKFQVKIGQDLLVAGRQKALEWLPDDETIFERTYFINQEFGIELQGKPYSVGIVMSVQCEKVELRTGKRRGELFPKATITGCLCLMSEQMTIYNQLTEGFEQTVIADSQDLQN